LPFSDQILTAFVELEAASKKITQTAPLVGVRREAHTNADFISTAWKNVRAGIQAGVICRRR